jgi:hypothetical protein
MSSWLTSPLALLVGFVASVIAISQALRGLTRKIVLFARRRAEQQLGHALVPVIAALVTGKGTQPPEGQDGSMYKA